MARHQAKSHGGANGACRGRGNVQPTATPNPMGEYRYGHRSRYSKMRSILVINPNSTEQMTNGLKPLVDALQFKDVNQRHPAPQARN